MSRVSENSSTAAINFSISKAKEKLEDLQVKGTTLKRISKPSDDPIANVESLSIKSEQVDHKQYLKNSGHALLQLNATERVLEQLTDIMVKAKEIALSQSSDIYDQDIRKNVANEIVQLRNSALALGNSRIGNRFIFSGHASLTRPFNQDGDYFGNQGRVHLEVSKDFFVPTNLTGDEIFYAANDTGNRMEHPLRPFSELRSSTKSETPGPGKRRPASVDDSSFKKRSNIFSQLNSLVSALENNAPELVRDLLPEIDSSVDRLITLRTRVGSVSNTIDMAKEKIENQQLANAERKSQLVDADVGELFSDITRQQDILKTAYQSGKGLLSQKLLDFLR